MASDYRVCGGDEVAKRGRTNGQLVNDRDPAGFGSSTTNTGFGNSGGSSSLFGGNNTTSNNTGFGGAYHLSRVRVR
jgi:hypothetical protein